MTERGGKVGRLARNMGIGRLLLTVYVVVLTSCSTSYHVVVVNDSASPITVEYVINVDRGQLVPLTREVADWRENLDKWEQWQSPSEMTFDQESSSYRVVIPPKACLWIERGIFNPITESKGELSSLKSIKFTSRDGEISYSGRMLLSQFDDRSGVYVKEFRNELTK